MDKLPYIGESIFTRMTKMANQYNAINLSQGFPNFPIDPELKKIVQQIAPQNIHQYTPMAGYTPLLEKIAELTLGSYQRTIYPETEILVTTGATQGIFTCIQALINYGDEVIILDPSYDSYEPSVILNNGKPIRVAMNDNFSTNWEAVEQACSSKTKMIIINNPHNPSGTILQNSDFLALENILVKYPNIVLLSDEVYEYIVFEEKHISVHTRPILQNRSIVISSFGKSLHITGWKIGYVIAPESLMKLIKKIHQFVVYSVNSISQVAICEYLNQVNMQELKDFYREKRDFFQELMQQTPFELLPCQGTYFQLASYKNISNDDDITFSEQLIKQYGVATIPLSPFYSVSKNLKLIRFCFSKDNKTLENAVNKLKFTEFEKN